MTIFSRTTPCFYAWNGHYSRISIYPQNVRPPSLLFWPLGPIFIDFWGSNGHFFTDDTLFRCLEQTQQANTHLSTKFQIPKLIGLAAKAFFEAYGGFRGQMTIFSWTETSTQRLSTYKISDLQTYWFRCYSVFQVIFLGFLGSNGHSWVAVLKGTKSCWTRGEFLYV